MYWIPAGEVAVKLSTGEPPASHYLSPELIADLVQTVDGGGFLGLRFLSDSLTF